MTRRERARYYEGIVTALQIINSADGVMGVYGDVVNNGGPLPEIIAAAVRLDTLDLSGLPEYIRFMSIALGPEMMARIEGRTAS